MIYEKPRPTVQKLISTVFAVCVTDVILFHVTENAHIRIHYYSAGIDHGLPRARSTGKLVFSLTILRLVIRQKYI